MIDKKFLFGILFSFFLISFSFGETSYFDKSGNQITKEEYESISKKSDKGISDKTSEVSPRAQNTISVQQKSSQNQNIQPPSLPANKAEYKPSPNASGKPTQNTSVAKQGTSAENQVDTVVYVTKTGSKYHNAGCRYLKTTVSENKSLSSPTITGTPTGETTARGFQIYQGPRGGLYHYSKNGNKVYEKKK
jgi:hypothetical protein